MDSDFHYYGTGTAALKAGFKDEDAALIANVAQYVDWFDSNYWSYWKMVDENGKPIRNAKKKQYEYNYPQLSVQAIDAKMAVDYDKDIWNAFHFPPGNLSYSTKNTDWRKTFESKHVLRITNLSKTDANKLCRPYSQFAFAMVEQTIDLYEKLIKMSKSELESWMNEYLNDRVRCPVDNPKTLAKYVVGIRMHVLADTWAHQDFTGGSSKAINGAGIINKVKAEDDLNVLQDTTWTGTAWVLHEDTDCAAAPTAYIDKACSGHGQVGHFPDYSWLTFQYPASWSKDSYVQRNNPKEYDEAWKWLSFVMKKCLDKKTSKIDSTPKEITDVMGTWHLLSDRGLVAVPQSERLWEATSLGKRLPKRWDPNKRRELGLYDGFPKTRYGYIHVIENSTLHYMELASSIHYQFCYDFFNNTNKNYTWNPSKPKT
jgi:hypothetical protein